MFNYSFWADEAGISSVAMQWITKKISLSSALNSPGIIYQRLHMLIVALSFKLFGISEMTARLPSLMAFFGGIIVIFFLAKKLSNVYGGILSAFLYGFSHLNLAYATQAKPYAAIETILLIVLYLLTNKKTNHILIIFLCTIATLLHSIGIFLWIPYGVYLFFKRRKTSPFIITAAFILGLILSYPLILSLIYGGKLFPYNYLYQFTKLFTYKYSFIFLSALFGFGWSFQKNKIISISLFIYSLMVFLMTTFRSYVFNIRYVLSLFGIIFLYFGIFWAKVGEHYLPKKKWFVPIIVIVLIYVTGYKIVRLPQAYYNPNIDKYGDVQIANYKDFYNQLKKRFPDYKNLYVINDIPDAENWYFGRYSNIYFMKFTKKNSLTDFKQIIKQHPRGILIMEDWESFLPEDIKQYAKKNFKLEYRINSLKEAPNDPWPLALYSWGIK